MSLRWKIALLLAVVVTVGVGTSSILTYRTTDSRLNDEVDRSLVNATQRFLRRPEVGRGRAVIDVPERPLGVELFVVQVLDSQGKVLAATDGVTLPITSPRIDSRGQVVPGFDTVKTAEGVDYRVRSVQVSVGVVQFGRDLTETNNVLADLRRRLVATTLSIVVIAAVIGWLIALGATSRLRRLSLAVETVATTGRLDVEAPVSGRDEAGRLGRTFRDMLGALSQSREQQQRLVEDAGHELRTPLTSLRTNLDVIRKHGSLDDATRQQILSDIDRDVSDLETLVEEVVAFAADRHTDELPEPVRLSDSVTPLVDRVRRRSGRSIAFAADDSICIVRRHMFERAVSNLIDNALKFDTSGGEIAVDITRGTVVVSDRGPGIPEDEQGKVFERFHRAVNARTLPGSGLGLSIVADVAETHGGKAFARNRVGGGAEVGFTLPLGG